MSNLSRLKALSNEAHNLLWSLRNAKAPPLASAALDAGVRHIDRAMELMETKTSQEVTP